MDYKIVILTLILWVAGYVLFFDYSYTDHTLFETIPKLFIEYLELFIHCSELFMTVHILYWLAGQP